MCPLTYRPSPSFTHLRRNSVVFQSKTEEFCCIPTCCTVRKPLSKKSPRFSRIHHLSWSNSLEYWANLLPETYIKYIEFFVAGWHCETKPKSLSPRNKAKRWQQFSKTSEDERLWHFSLVLSDLSTYFGWYYITANTNTESVGMSGIWNNQSVYIQCWQGAAAMGDLPNCWMLLQKLRTRTLEHQRSKELFGIYGKNVTEYECKLLNCVTPTSKRVPLPVLSDFNHCYFSIPCLLYWFQVSQAGKNSTFHFTGFKFSRTLASLRPWYIEAVCFRHTDHIRAAAIPGIHSCSASSLSRYYTQHELRSWKHQGRQKTPIWW